MQCSISTLGGEQARSQETMPTHAPMTSATILAALEATGKKKVAEASREKWRDSRKEWPIDVPATDSSIGWLPVNSWVIRFTFTLERDLLTKD